MSLCSIKATDASERGKRKTGFAVQNRIPLQGFVAKWI
jgi:hypothetical protein